MIGKLLGHTQAQTTAHLATDPVKAAAERVTGNIAALQSWEGCVWMMKIRAEWASEHGQNTKIGLSDGCGGKTFTMAVEFG